VEKLVGDSEREEMNIIEMSESNTAVLYCRPKGSNSNFFIFWFIFDSVLFYHAGFFCLSRNKVSLLEMGHKLVFS